MREASRLLALDGLRGLAVVAVVCSHLVERPASVASAADVGALVFDSGWWGVDLFFALSGYLVTGILLDTRREPGAMRSFFGRRALRIWPMSLVTMGLIFAAIPPFFPEIGFTPPAGVVATYLLFAGNLWITFVGWPPIGGFMWSVFIEEQFYFVWPWVVRRWRDGTLERICLAIALFSLAIRASFLLAGESRGAYVFTLGRLDGLALGAFVALAARRLSPASLARWATRSGLVALGACVALVLWRGALDMEDPVAIGPGISLLSVLAASTVALVVSAPEGLVARAFTNGGLRWFGRHSYALYLLHRPIMIALERSRFRDVLPPAAMAVVYVALSCAAAWASWHLVEKRFLALKRLFPREATSPREAPLREGPVLST